MNKIKNGSITGKVSNDYRTGYNKNSSNRYHYIYYMIKSRNCSLSKLIYEVREDDV
jgi:hypothetical protein